MVRKYIVIFILIIISVFFPFSNIFADEYDDLEKEITKLQTELEAVKSATKPLKSDLERLEKQLGDIKVRINTIQKDLVEKEKQLEISQKQFEYQKEILDARVTQHYKNIKKSEISLLNLLVSNNLPLSVQHYFYQKKAADNDKQVILRIVFHMKNLEDAKTSLLSEKTRLAETQKKVDAQSKFLEGEIGKSTQYQKELTQKIASLTSRQQQILAQKLSSLNLPTSLGAGPLYCTDDRNIDPGFSPAWAFFTFGIPHRVGMNQYGALGRAQAGQNEEEILKAYFDNFELKKDYDQNITITVEGYGPYSIEDYVKRIYEIPASWPMAALKAQAVAARSYALSYTNNGSKSICATQSCQVFKPDEKGGDWNRAVEETKGWVMVQGGTPITAWYASTAGGYTFRSDDVGWNYRDWTKRLRDTSGDINSFSDLKEKSYDKDSPCAYAAQGWRAEYAKSAWLKAEEIADIVNVLMLAKTDSSIQTHLAQTDKPNPDGEETWDTARVKQELQNRGIKPYNSISSISIGADFSIGKTNSVNISGDAGSNNFSGDEFKNFFNLRAPANIQIVGPLYNIENR